MYIKYIPELMTPQAIQKQIADRLRERRLEKNLSQEGLSKLSGVSYASLKKFESTGEISLKSLIKIAVAMDMVMDFEKLFSEPKYSSMDELLLIKKRKNRKRGTNHD